MSEMQSVYAIPEGWRQDTAILVTANGETKISVLLVRVDGTGSVVGTGYTQGHALEDAILKADQA